MQRNWTEKNVDLTLLRRRVSEFFKKDDFEVVEEETSVGFQVLAANSPNVGIQGIVSVTIEGTSEDFTVSLDLSGDMGRRSWLSPFLKMFGGGYFILQQMKAEEAWTKLEKEFWKYMENTVIQLGNSATPQRNHPNSMHA